MLNPTSDRAIHADELISATKKVSKFEQCREEMLQNKEFPSTQCCNTTGMSRGQLVLKGE